jgi:hypothetical protein
VQNNQKWMLLAFIPLISIASVIAYRRARFNYTEHLVIAAFCLSGALTVALACALLEAGLARAFGMHGAFGSVLVFLFVLMAYWQAHRHRYSVGGWIWRTAAALLIFSLLFIIALSAAVLLVAYFTEGSSFFSG